MNELINKLINELMKGGVNLVLAEKNTVLTGKIDFSFIHVII